MSLNKNISKQKKKSFTKKILRLFLELSLVVIFSFMGVFLLEIFAKSYEQVQNGFEPGVSYQVSSPSKVVVLGEEDENNPESNLEEKEIFLASENFRAKQVIFGGDALLPLGKETNPELKINEVYSELLTTKNKEEIKLLISWKTNKPARSEVEYSKGGNEEGGQIIQEDKFSYSHSAVLSSLDPASAYTYKIKAVDQWGNEIISDRFAFYTGAPNISLLDLLFGAFKDVFGWAMKK